MNVAQFVFFNEESTTPVSNAFGNIGYGSSLTLQVAPVIPDMGVSVDLVVEGVVDLDKPEVYYPLKVVSLETFKTMSSIHDVGIYMVIIEGVSKVRVRANDESAVGNIKVYAVSNN